MTNLIQKLFKTQENKGKDCCSIEIKEIKTEPTISEKKSLVSCCSSLEKEK